jgi:hypothetical protein
MASNYPPIRRVVTGHDADHIAKVIRDEPATNAKYPQPGLVSTMMWCTDGAPAKMPVGEQVEDMGARVLGTAPPKNGTRFAVIDFPSARKLTWAVGIPRHLKVYPADVRMIWPVANRGRPRQRHVPNILSIPAEDMLAHAKWHTISWRTGTKGKLKARFAAVRVRVADGPPQRIRNKGQQHLPGDEAWLIGEHRMSGEKKFISPTCRRRLTFAP